ncbi:MAG: competence type IV pilus minor pilin ComGF [Lactobacillus sp.]|nr:competence type IV pilus minor pilin ComGF [Lactobacillus sp.]
MKIKGFTLIETVIALMISALTVMILQATLLNLKSIKQSKLDCNDIAFAYVQLDKFLHNREVKRCIFYPKKSDQSHAVFKLERTDGDIEFDLYQVNGKLALKPGHIPLLVNVKSTSFAMTKELLTITVVDQNNLKSEIVVKSKN